MSEADPVSWLLIEPGWKVIDSEGSDVGHVEEVEGDSNADIFSGLLISTGLFGGKRYVPAEQIGLITEDRVHLTLNGDEVKRLRDESGPPGAA
jgi:uncharacterized protein YrrD